MKCNNNNTADSQPIWEIGNRVVSSTSFSLQYAKVDIGYFYDEKISRFLKLKLWINLLLLKFPRAKVLCLSYLLSKIGINSHIYNTG